MYGLISRSMRCISAITASSAAPLRRASPCHSSTRIAVPMIASSRLNQRADAAAAAGTGPAARGRNVGRFSRMAKGFARVHDPAGRAHNTVHASRGRGIFAEPLAPIASRSWQTAIALRAVAQETAAPANRWSGRVDTPRQRATSSVISVWERVACACARRFGARASALRQFAAGEPRRTAAVQLLDDLALQHRHVELHAGSRCAAGCRPGAGSPRASAASACASSLSVAAGSTGSMRSFS